jgi:16S rRNA U1498 N3-methylase RsmE
MPREGSAFWLVKPPPADENDDDDDAEVVMLTAHPGAAATVGDVFGDLSSSSSSSSGRPRRTRAVVAVGPEGGWTDFERRSLLDAGFVEVALGRRTFATDVACVALVAAVRERTSSW